MQEMSRTKSLLIFVHKTDKLNVAARCGVIVWKTKSQYLKNSQIVHLQLEFRTRSSWIRGNRQIGRRRSSEMAVVFKHQISIIHYFLLRCWLTTRIIVFNREICKYRNYTRFFFFVLIEGGPTAQPSFIQYVSKLISNTQFFFCCCCLQFYSLTLGGSFLGFNGIVQPHTIQSLWTTWTSSFKNSNKKKKNNI